MKLALSQKRFFLTRDTAHKNSRAKILSLAALTGILLLAAALRFLDIESLGYVNHYYAAAVTSMLQSWHNFFFAAAEPGGAVTVDKPPVGLWLQTISAYFLGVNTVGLLLPQILAGLGSIVLVYHLVRRSFGDMAGLLSALALAVMPVVVATDRNNTVDSTMIFTLLLAAWAFIKATETSKMRYLVLGSFLVGVAFNIKMMAAYLPVPAFFALYFFGAREGLWRKIGKLTLAGILLLAISLSWAIAVDLTPADQRPYVGSSGDNSEFTLIVGYNGINRLTGMARGGGNNDGAGNQPRDGQPNTQANSARPNPPQDGGPNTRANSSRPNPASNTQLNRPQGGGGGTPSNIGQVGIFRLFTSSLKKEVSWLLPLGLFGMILLLFASRIQFPVSENHQALILWGGWLVTGGVFFSIASYFHEYYLSLLGAPLAALVGIALMALWQMRKEKPIVATTLAVITAGGTLAFQFYIVYSFVSSTPWMVPTLMVGVIGAAIWFAPLKSPTQMNLARVGLSLLIFSVFVTPTIWSAYTAMNPGNNLSLPAAYSGRESSPSNRGNVQVNKALLDYLEANTQDTKYLMAVPTSMQGSDYVIATARPVLYVGGFKGSDEVVSVEDLAQMTSDGELRYLYWSERGGMGGSAEISNWLNSSCKLVDGFATTTRNSGAPDGTTPTPNSNNGNQSITLYDCKAEVQ